MYSNQAELSVCEDISITKGMMVSWEFGHWPKGVTLKGQCNELFTGGFFHESSSRGLLIFLLAAFRNFAKIFEAMGAPPVLTTPAESYPLVSLTPAENLPPWGLLIYIGDCVLSRDGPIGTTLHPPLFWLDNTFKVKEYMAQKHK